MARKKTSAQLQREVEATLSRLPGAKSAKTKFEMRVYYSDAQGEWHFFRSREYADPQLGIAALDDLDLAPGWKAHLVERQGRKDIREIKAVHG